MRGNTMGSRANVTPTIPYTLQAIWTPKLVLTTSTTCTPSNAIKSHSYEFSFPFSFHVGVVIQCVKNLFTSSAGDRNLKFIVVITLPHTPYPTCLANLIK